MTTPPNLLNLSQLRRSKGWTQDKLCKRLKVSRRTLTWWEAGNHPGPDNMRKIAKILEVEPETITAAIESSKR